MTAFYDSLALTAARLLAQYGRDVVRRRPGAASPYSPSSGTASVPAASEATFKGALLDFQGGQKEVRGNTINVDDKRLLLEPAAAPTADDAFVIGGIYYAVVSRGEVAPGGTPVVYDLHVRGEGSPVVFLPSETAGLAAWFRPGVGVATVDGLVSQWDDQSGNGRHLKQVSAAARPSLSPQGVVIFPSVAENRWMQTDAFVLSQPVTIYALLKPTEFNSAAFIFDGLNVQTAAVLQNAPSPQIGMSSGLFTAARLDLLIGSYAVVSAVFDGASSSLMVNKNAATTGSAGLGVPGGLTIGAKGGGGGGNNAAVEFKELAAFSGAHDAATRTKLVEYLAAVGGLSL